MTGFSCSTTITPTENKRERVTAPGLVCTEWFSSRRQKKNGGGFYGKQNCTSASVVCFGRVRPEPALSRIAAELSLPLWRRQSMPPFSPSEQQNSAARPAAATRERKGAAGGPPRAGGRRSWQMSWQMSSKISSSGSSEASPAGRRRARVGQPSWSSPSPTRAPSGPRPGSRQ